MTKRGLGVAVVLLLAAAGCVPGGTSAQSVELVAGGGETDGGPAADAFIDGRLVDMTVDRAGTLRVLTENDAVATMWTVQAGTLSHVVVPELNADYISQMTVDPVGAVYVALWNGEGGVWHISPQGRATRRLGIDRDTYRGDREPSADGAAAAGAYLQYLHGVAVGPDSRIYFAEERIRPTTHQLVRTVDGGKLKTVLGRDLAGLTAREWRSARTREGGFPDGIPGPRIALEGGLNNLIALGADGTVYAGPGRRSVVAVRADGSAHELIGNLAGGAVDDDLVGDPEEPFAGRGPAARASVWLKGARAGKRESNASLVTDDRGNVYVTSVRSGRDELPDDFDWTGDATGRQRDLLKRSREQRESRTDTTEVLQIRPDGSLATAAGHADAAAVQGDWLYLARAFTDDENTGRVLVVRTAIPR
ncbi:hypothetical protein [Actinoplanes sp. NPDC049599]|uniref:hypothetical protein n=1 Tax=Actinoplanes sp. NPDC049599 TaxID=3363903 RepID=UPI0037BC91AD